MRGLPRFFFGSFSWCLIVLHFRNVSSLAGNMIDVANFAVKQSPSSTRLITNKMCPFAQKAWIALEAANAPYEMEEISLYGPNGKPDWFLELNPKGTVPVLVCHGGAVCLRDSDLILDEIGTAVENGSSVVPKDEADIEKVKEFRAKLNEFLPIGKKAVLGGSKQKMWTTLAELDAMVEGPYVCGDKVTVADCAAFPFIWRIDTEYGIEDQGCVKLRVWLDHCKSNEAFSKTIQQSWWWWW